MGLVQHPGADFALIQHATKGLVAQLLRRDDHQPGVPEPDPVQRIDPLGHGQQPVDRDARADAVRLQPRHLIRHECDQGRDHHRQGTGVVVAGKGGDLVAERLAGPGGQDPEDMFPGHCRLDNGLLHRSAIGARRLRAEVGEAEPAEKLLSGVVTFPAPAAGGIGACGVPKPANQPPRLRELVADPGRHDRVAPGHRQPGQGIGQRPAFAGRVRQDLAGLGLAGVTRQPASYRCAGLGVRGARRPSQAREEVVEPGALTSGRRQPVPGEQQIRESFAQGLVLIAKDVQREPGIELGVVHPPALELPVLVVLDQVVIGIARKGEGIEPQRIDGRQPQQPKIGLCRGEMRQVEEDQVVPQQEVGSTRELVQPRQCRCQVAAAKDAPFAGIRAHRGERMDAAVLLADFEVQRETGGRKCLASVRGR